MSNGQIVFVGGMHRSGTSAFTRVLNLMGCEIPEPVVGPSPWNEHGHWEPEAVVLLNDRVLHAAGSEVNGLVPIPAAWFNSSEAQRWVDEMAALLAPIALRPDIAVIKDPRISLLAGLWRQAAERVGAAPRFAVVVRHPWETAASLAKRQLHHFPHETWTIERGLALWINHNLALEVATRGTPRAFVSYDALLLDWRSATERANAQLALPDLSPSPDAAHAISAFLAPEARHSRKEQLLTVDGPVMDLYRLLLQKAEAPAHGDADLDRMRAAFDTAFTVLGPYIAALEQKAHYAQAQSPAGQKDPSEPMDLTQSRASHTAGLTNIALGKDASQSSLSEWSHEGEAADAVSGQTPNDFAFHTAEEDNPWWMVDLGALYPLETIVVHNRRAMLQERARTLKVEIAETGGDWTLIHAGYARFGAGEDGRPLALWIGSDLQARYVRLSLEERQMLHLSQVEVFVRPDRLAVAQYCNRFGLPAFGLAKTRTLTPYTLERSPSAIGDEVVGLKISYSGRFGNLLHQFINAIQLAERTGLRYVQLGRHPLLDVKHAFKVGEITFLPPDAPLPIDGTFISGEFFNSDDFAPVLSPFLQFTPQDEVAATNTVQTYIVPHMLTGIPLPGEEHPEDELTIHLRAGDIFDCDEPVTFGYRQPPLSFYKLVVERMRAAGRITRARLVYEDRGNPCIDALAAWLETENIPYRVQCGTLHEDMSALIDAPHLVFGHGTFGYAACRLSKRVRTVHFFAPELGGSYGDMPTIEEAYRVSDTGGYIKAFEYGKPFGEHDGWRNTPAMRELMLTYPIDKLRVETVRGSTSS